MVTVLWHRPGATGTVHLRRRDAAGGPGGTLDLTPPTSGQADLAVGADGSAYVAWATAAGGAQQIHMRRVDPLTVRLRGRAVTNGCAYGKAATLRLRTKVVGLAT